MTTTKAAYSHQTVQSQIKSTLEMWQSDSTAVKSPLTQEEYSQKIQNEIVVTRILTVEQVMGIWEAIAQTAIDKGVDLGLVLQTSLRCVQKGAFFLVTTYGQFAGFSCVEISGQIAVVHNLPAAGLYNLGRIMLEVVTDWARKYGCRSIQVTSNTNRGSAHKYFKSLGFSAAATTYEKHI